ncbi:MAG: dephospho-CoA kinase [Venatoribacter sp.]
MFILGLTGGIGSGKTAASQFFIDQGIVVVDADIVAREVVQPQQPAWQAIKERFGDDVLLASGELNRAWLRQKVFAEPEQRLWLESQTHPRIRESMLRQLQQANSAYAILASPLLFETDQAKLVQRSLLIDVAEDVQLSRAASRDANSLEQIKRIMAVQMPRLKRQSFADDIVDNSGSLENLYQQLQTLHQRYLTL